MPVPEHTVLADIPQTLATKVGAYNASVGKTYNPPYADYIAARETGVAAYGCLSAWLANDGAVPIRRLLVAFGMDARNSRLVSHDELQKFFSGLNPAAIDWVAGLSLPLRVQPAILVNPATGENLFAELRLLYDTLASRGSVTESGGYVAASKTMHSLFPQLAPMVDGKHSGLSYSRISPATYIPPLGIGSWRGWVGAAIEGVINPSPQGAGRNSWRWQQFVAAVGINQHIYELWQAANGGPGLQAFLSLDPTAGTNGIPRIVDKALWTTYVGARPFRPLLTKGGS